MPPVPDAYRWAYEKNEQNGLATPYTEHDTTGISEHQIKAAARPLRKDDTFPRRAMLPFDYHFAPLLEGRDCMALEYLNDLMWRSTQRFGMDMKPEWIVPWDHTAAMQARAKA